MAVHKYGFHCNRTGDDVFDAIVRIKPKVIKAMDQNVDFWRRVREVHPDAFLIGRHYETNQAQDQFVQDPAAKGRAFAEKVLSLEVNRATFQGKPLFDAWESYNEIMPGHADEALKRAYNEFQVAFAGPIKAAGFEPIAMNFATGNMLGSDFLTYFRETLDAYRYLGFHEYDWPDMWRLHEQNIREKDEGGMWLTLRYRRVMNEVRRLYGDRHTVIITECGMTQGVQGGEDVGPWHESHPISEQRYWDSLAWYNDELMQDDYVMGACLFVVGAVDPWQSFEHLGGIVNRLEQLQSGNPPPVETRPDLPAAGPAAKPPEPAALSPTPSPAPDIPLAKPLEQALAEEGARRQLLRFNPQAALQKVIFRDGFVPNSEEFTLETGGVQYVAQQAEHLGTGETRVYYVVAGDWGNVRHVTSGMV